MMKEKRSKFLRKVEFAFGTVEFKIPVGKRNLN
jgi:hypothetical protein